MTDSQVVSGNYFLISYCLAIIVYLNYYRIFMIQRIQTVYLLIVTVALITAMCLPMGYFVDATGAM